MRQAIKLIVTLLYATTALVSVAMLAALAAAFGLIIAVGLGEHVLHISHTLAVVCAYALSIILLVIFELLGWQKWREYERQSKEQARSGIFWVSTLFLGVVSDKAIAVLASWLPRCIHRIKTTWGSSPPDTKL